MQTMKIVWACCGQPKTKGTGGHLRDFEINFAKAA
jgi:hypothetical protein